jgi:hypothetical protein
MFSDFSASSEYIMDYVWKSEPEGLGNIFFKTQRVQFKQGSDMDKTAMASTKALAFKSNDAPTANPIKAPTFMPTQLPTPTPGTPTKKPASLPANLILIEASLDYGFFSDVSLRAPTQAEIDSVMDQTSKFFEQFLKSAFTNLQSFTALPASPAVFNPANPFPVHLSFKATLSFTPSKFASKAPTGFPWACLFLMN